MLQQPKSYAAQLLASTASHGSTSSNYISHGITKTPMDAVRRRRAGSRSRRTGEDGHRRLVERSAVRVLREPHRARARRGMLDPLIGRTEELQRTIEVLCRRRKNNPVFVGDAGVGKTAMAEGLATRLLDDDVQEPLAGRGGLLARHRSAARRHALPRRLRGALQGGRQRAHRAAAGRSSSSTRCTPRSAPAPSPAAPWIWRRC